MFTLFSAQKHTQQRIQLSPIESNTNGKQAKGGMTLKKKKYKNKT